MFLLARAEQLSYKKITVRLNIDARAVGRHLNNATPHRSTTPQATESR
ncbi:hypothetical protein [Pseudomonas sp. IPO3778]